MAVLKMPRSVKATLRILFSLSIFGICIFVLSGQVSDDLWRGLPEHFGAIPVGFWLAAITLTVLSFFAVGRYDGVAHRHLQTGIPQKHAEMSGMIAISVAQTLGFGLFTGAIARWRKLPGLGLGQALILSTFVSVSFIVGWCFVTALACLFLPSPSWSKLPACVGVVALPLLLFVLFRWPRPSFRGITVKLPSLRLASAILFWSVVDMAAAGAALWMLLPADAGVSLAAFIPIYMLALGAALISNTPGGVGPFELVLISALPHIPAEALLQSIIAFRAVYYAGPACLGAIALIRPFPVAKEEPFLEVPNRRIREAARSETQVLRQNGGYLADTANGIGAFWPTPQTVTAMFAPVQGSLPTLLARLSRIARQSGRWPLLYKASARDTLAARKLGWTVLHVADDAFLDPLTFSKDVPARRTLRRKLRAAQKSKLEIAVPQRLPFRQLEDIDAQWIAEHGPARGGTMGRYSPEYVADQWVAVAYQNHVPVAFVTFFVGPDEWALDLMRQTKSAPDGTMHALVATALEHAQTSGIRRFSLAATPACPDPASAIWREVAKAVVARAGGPGLRQFKSAFAPQWVPRYAAAPGPLRLGIALADVARSVHHPLPLRDHSSKNIHERDENYELESKRIA